MNNPQRIIAVDPDTKSSGVAYLDTETRCLEATTYTFPQLLDYLQRAREARDAGNVTLVVIVEAGWLNPSHWHGTTADTGRVTAAKGNAVGRNHEVGRKIVEMCKHYGLEVVEQRPLRKCWTGPGGKITAGEIEAITGLRGRVSQDARDAALIAWYSAGFPMIITPKNKKQ